MDGDPEVIKTLQAENAALQRQLQEQESQMQSLLESETNYRSLIEMSPDGIAIHRKGHFLYMNQRGIEMMGASTLEEVQTRTVIEYVHPDYRQAVIDRVKQTQEAHEEVQFIEEQFVRLDGLVIDVEVAGTPILYQGEPASQVIFRDITERKKAERSAQEVILQQQTIAAQQDALRELSTPLIPLSADVVLIPLIGKIDDERAQMVIETLLEGISTYQASMAIVDITGVSMVDSQVANMILQAAQAVRLLGAHVILTGIGPEMAQTLVQLGANLSGVRTCGTLESAVAEALQKDTTPLQKSHTLSSYTKR
jgi:rsbT co-antagonist protein RsbR